MAQDLAAVMGKILARSLGVLREECVLSRLINTDYSEEAKEKGDTIDVPIADEATVSDVTPSNTDPAPSELNPTKVQISLNKWKKANFKMTDKDKLEVSEKAGYLPQKVLAAVKKLANQINTDLYAEYKGVYGYVGTAGTTPFGAGRAELDAIDTRKILNDQLCPDSDRRIILDTAADAKALSVAAIADADKVGAAAEGPKIRGRIGTRYGFDFYFDQLIPTHTAGTGAGYLVNDAAGLLVGATTATVDTGAGTILVGDIVTFAGHSQTYAVTVALAANVFTFTPALKAVVADNAAVTLKASHVVNLAFSRDAFALAVRTALDDTADESLAKTMTMVDPLTGLPLRLEIRRQHKQTVWEFDVLYGVKLIRAALASRIAG
jgi:hypothetical protein